VRGRTKRGGTPCGIAGDERSNGRRATRSNSPRGGSVVQQRAANQNASTPCAGSAADKPEARTGLPWAIAV